MAAELATCQPASCQPSSFPAFLSHFCFPPGFLLPFLWQLDFALVLEPREAVSGISLGSEWLTWCHGGGGGLCFGVGGAAPCEALSLDLGKLALVTGLDGTQ